MVFKFFDKDQRFHSEELICADEILTGLGATFKEHLKVKIPGNELTKNMEAYGRATGVRIGRLYYVNGVPVESFKKEIPQAPKGSTAFICGLWAQESFLLDRAKITPLPNSLDLQIDGSDSGATTFLGSTQAAITGLKCHPARWANGEYTEIRLTSDPSPQDLKKFFFKGMPAGWVSFETPN
jgi:hypothetical protein